MSAIQIVCPNPTCNTMFELGGMLDFGALPDTGFKQGTTDAVLGADRPACATHLEFRWTASWRTP